MPPALSWPEQSYFYATLPTINQSGTLTLDWANWVAFSMQYNVDNDGRSNTCAMGGTFACEPSLYYSLSANAINEVPLPASAWLFGSALIGLVKLRKKKQA